MKLTVLSDTSVAYLAQARKQKFVVFHLICMNMIRSKLIIDEEKKRKPFKPNLNDEFILFVSFKCVLASHTATSKPEKTRQYSSKTLNKKKQAENNDLYSLYNKPTSLA